MTICTAMGQQPQQQQPRPQQQQQQRPAETTESAGNIGGNPVIAFDERLGATEVMDPADPKSQVEMGVTTTACNIPNCVVCNGQEECLSCAAPFFLDRKRQPKESCVRQEDCSLNSRPFILEGGSRRICLDSTTSGAKRIRLG